MRQLTDSGIPILRVKRTPVPAVPISRNIEMKSAGQIREKRSKSDYEPLREIEWLKKNLLHQLERFAKRLEDFDLWFGAVHWRRFQSVWAFESSWNATSGRVG